MTIIPAIDLAGYSRLSPRKLNQTFTVQDIFQPGKIELRYWETDRTIIGAAVPLRRPLPLGTYPALAAEFFNQRRELGIINIGGPGSVTVDGKSYNLATHDGLYVGRGAKQVVFASASAATPARYYLLSYPAHAKYPTKHIRFARTAGLALGSVETGNSRTLYKFIHQAGVKSCQLVMGVTILNPGSKWNSMPPHTHYRRSEVYLYFNLKERASVKHFLGEPSRIKSTKLRNEQAAISPPWSVHCGVGTSHYSFVWGMGGENQEFSDMDPVDPALITAHR